jgi:hypothetical protein
MKGTRPQPISKRKHLKPQANIADPCKTAENRLLRGPQSADIDQLSPTKKHSRQSKQKTGRIQAAENQRIPLNLSRADHSKSSLPSLVNISNPNDQTRQPLLGTARVQELKGHHPGRVSVIKAHRHLATQIKRKGITQSVLN